MLAYQHFIASASLGLALGLSYYYLTRDVPISLMIMLASLTSGVLIDVDHFQLSDYPKALRCALVSDINDFKKTCDIQQDKGVFHTKAFGLCLFVFALSWLVHYYMDYLWTR